MEVKEIEELISDYRWMKREVLRLEELLSNMTVKSSHNDNLTVNYDIEATLPKGSSGMSAAEYDQLDRRERKLIDRINRYKEIIEFVELGEDHLQNPIHVVIYSCMMEGMSYRAIAAHLEMSKDMVRKHRDNLISHLSQNRHYSQTWRYLKYQKQIV
ncbi:sigma-70 family RNA polymerase sigma factor [Geomicrobium sediminis]|uniref:DNA-binding NarL/FixJ family response regulator n=1 Tax=Geomicrobium sediminis TaxID=1347788 RepID=A0ABS2PEI8_9BACL|nr:sigma-70 family RNA polymerase sigma factor [Geomicrobium sediminis]MBM7633844.1 DNA-binding NarL/FixJ family response regulator [Geomicrobium sediminis]